MLFASQIDLNKCLTSYLLQKLYRWRNKLIVYELIWHVYCINDMIHGLIAHIECWFAFYALLEKWYKSLLCLAIIDFVNNSINPLLIYWFEDSHWLLWSTNPLQARSSFLCLCLANRCIVSGLISLTILGSNLWKGFLWLGLYSLAFLCPDCL